MENPTLSQLADEYNVIRTMRLDKDKEAAKLKERENALKDELIARMKAEGYTAVGASTCLIRYHKKDEPTVTEWEKVWGYIQATGEFELLQKRLTPTAVIERWDANIEIPGIGHFPVESISVSQIKPLK